MDKAEIAKEFDIDPAELEACEILFAAYELGSYDGEAEIIFRKDGKLFTVSGGHCSCMGLEGQWSPVEVNAETLQHFLRKASYGIYSTHDGEIREALERGGVVLPEKEAHG